jgi:hypothetical protein
MSQSIGSLVIKLEAQTAALRTDMAEARRIIDTNTNTMQRAFSGVSSAARTTATAIGSIGIALGVSELVSYARTVIDTVGALGEMADQVGVTTDALQALQFQALQSGASVETLEGGLARFTRSVGDAAEGNDALLDRFKQLGVGILDSTGKLRSNESILGDVAQALDKIDDPAKRAAAVVDLFGKSGQKLLPLLKDLAEVGIDGLIVRAKEAGAVVDEQLIKRFDALSDAAALNAKRLTVFAADGIGAIIDAARAGKQALDEMFTSAGRVPSPGAVGPRGARPQNGLPGFSLPQGSGPRNSRGGRVVGPRAAAPDVFAGADASGLDLGVRSAAPSANQNPTSTRDLQGIIAGDQLVRQLATTRDSMNLTQAAQLRLRLEREMDTRVVNGQIVTEQRYSAATINTAVAIQAQIDAAQELQSRLQSVYDDAAARDAAQAREAQGFRDLAEARRAYLRNLDEAAERQQREIALAGQGQIVWNRYTKQFELVNRELEIFNRQQEILARNLGFSEAEARAQAEAQVDAAEKQREAQQKQNAEIKRQQETYDFVANAGERAFDRVGDAMAQMAVEGGNAFASLRSVAAGVVASIYADFLKLAIANPLKNLLLGTESPTLGGVGGLFGKMFGQGDQGGGMMSVAAILPGTGSFAPGGFAKGGRPPVGKPSIVGENGMELFVPDVAGRVYPANDTAAMLGGGGGDTYYIDARGADSAGLARVERQIAALNGSLEKRALTAFAEDYSRGGQTSKVMRAS